MSNLPVKPLADLVRRASRQLPRQGEVHRREQRIGGGSGAQCIVADISASMRDAVGATSKLARLKEALADLCGYCPEAKIVYFNSVARWGAALSVPSPDGGTALHLALDAASAIRPSRTVVITDGEPDSESAALESAGRLTGRIDVIYCGSENNVTALAFLARLARESGGTVSRCDLRWQPSLAVPLRALLGPGA